MESQVGVATWLATKQPLNTLDELMSVAISINSNLLQLLVTHVSQHIQRDLEKGKDKTFTISSTSLIPLACLHQIPANLTTGQHSCTVYSMI